MVYFEVAVGLPAEARGEGGEIADYVGVTGEARGRSDLTEGGEVATGGRSGSRRTLW